MELQNRAGKPERLIDCRISLPILPRRIGLGLGFLEVQIWRPVGMISALVDQTRASGANTAAKMIARQNAWSPRTGGATGASPGCLSPGSTALVGTSLDNFIESRH